MKNDNIAPKEWDRNGLPGWTYFSDDLLDVENEELFRKHWQLVCHINDIPEPGDFHYIRYSQRARSGNPWP